MSPGHAKRHLHKHCFYCGEPDVRLLDAHRVVPGSQGGKYSYDNVIPACSLCHRKVHCGRIKVLNRRQDSLGRWFIHYSEDGVEHWHREDRWWDR